MTILFSHAGGSSTGIERDCTLMFLDRLSNDGQQWLLQVFPSTSSLLPVVMARQEMAGHIDLQRPPDLVNSDFRVVRIGESTFDLEGSLVDLCGRTVVRSTTVIAVTDRLTTRMSAIPGWLKRTLKESGR